MSTPKFETINPSLIIINYKEKKFMLKEKSRGCLGLGKAVQLLHMDGLDAKHLIEVGWTKGDNHGSSGMQSALINKITTMEECKKAAIKFIDSLI